MSYESFAEELRKWWSFDNRQMHTHSWHGREDFIKGRMRELIDAETKPLHIDIEAQAELIVDAIIEDLSGRRGLRQEWEACDEGIQAEIRAEWMLIARRLIERG